MKRIVLVLFLLSSAQVLFSQVDFQVDMMENQLKEMINEMREERNLPLLEADEILDAVAFDQAQYIAKSGKLSHEQEQGKKKLLIDRILFFEGLNAKAGENIASIAPGSKVKVDNSADKKIASSPDIVLQAAMYSWFEEEEGRLNLLDPEFLLFGTSVLENDQHEIILVLVMANEAYENPDQGKPQFNHEGISEYNEEDCKAILTKYPSLAQLFSDAFVVEGNQIFFEFHNLAFVEDIISDGGDAIGVDLIKRSQYSCAGSNRLFPGSIHDGFLLNPAKKGKLSSLNLKKEEAAVKLSLGKVPDFYQDKDYEINGLIIKNGSHCLTVPYNQITTHNERWIGFPMLYASPNIDSNKSTIDTSYFKFLFSDFEDKLKDMELYMKGLNYGLDDVIVDGITGPIAFDLQDAPVRKRFHEVFNPYYRQEPYVNIEIKEDWAPYLEYKKGTFYQLETKGMDRAQELAYLKKTVQSDSTLASALKAMNRIEMSISGVLSLNPNQSQADRLQLFHFLVEQDNINMALEIQTQILETAISKGESIDFFIAEDQSQVKKTLPLINNQIIAQDQVSNKKFAGNSIHTALLELYLIDPNNATVSYNYHLALLRFWSKSTKRVGDLDKWKKGFEKLRASSIPKTDYAKAYLNYLVIAADHYYEKAEIDKRKKAFDTMEKLVGQAELSDEQLLFLAQYLCHQDQLSVAVKIMLPEVKKESPNRDLLFYFLQIARYDSEQVSEKSYVQFIQKAQVNFPEDFCALFSKEKMGIQMLEFPDIKAIYCAHCNQ